MDVVNFVITQNDFSKYSGWLVLASECFFFVSERTSGLSLLVLNYKCGHKHSSNKQMVLEQTYLI